MFASTRWEEYVGVNYLEVAKFVDITIHNKRL